MNILSGLYRPDSGEILIDDTPRDLHATRARRSTPGSGWCTSTSSSSPCSTSSRRSRSARRASRTARDLRPQDRARQRVVELSEQYQPQRQPRREDRGPPRRRAPAGRDPQGALPQERHPRPRRAVCRAHAVRDRGAVRDHPRPRGGRARRSSSSPTSSTRSSRSRTGSPSCAAGGWPARVDPKTATREQLANLMVGRDVELRVAQGPGEARARSCSRCKDLHVRDDRFHMAVKDVTSRSAPARSSPSPASRATARPSSSRPSSASGPSTRARSTSTATASSTSARARSRTWAWPTSPRTAIRDGLIAAHDGRRELHPRLLPPAAVQQGRPARPRGDQRARPSRRSRTTTSGRRRSTPTRARCPAATSRRSSSPASSAARVKLVIASQPTRGLDVGSIEYIHRRIVEQRDAGGRDPDRQHRARRGARRRRPRGGHAGRPDRGDRGGRDATYENVGMLMGGVALRRLGRALRPALVPILAIITAFIVGSIFILITDFDNLSKLGTDPVGAIGQCGQHRHQRLQRDDPRRVRRSGQDQRRARQPDPARHRHGHPADHRDAGRRDAADLHAASRSRSRSAAACSTSASRASSSSAPSARPIAAIALKDQPDAADPRGRDARRRRSRAPSGASSRASSRRRPAPTRSSRPSCSTTSPPRSSCSACARTSCARRQLGQPISKVLSDFVRIPQILDLPCDPAPLGLRPRPGHGRGRVLVPVQDDARASSSAPSGFNMTAARYAGMSASGSIILAMTLSGGLAGLGGSMEVLGHRAPDVERHQRGLRLQRDRPRPARRQPAARDRRRGTAVRRAAHRRRPDAGQDRHPARPADRSSRRW